MDTTATTAIPANTPSDDELYRGAANEFWAKDKLEIDDDATVSAGEGGAWVHAWVWVSSRQAGIEDLSVAEESESE
jgi:hypothetical protein